MSSNIFWELRDTRGNVATFPLEQLYLQDKGEYPSEIQDKENPFKFRKWGISGATLDNFYLRGVLSNSNPFGIGSGLSGSSLDSHAYLNPVFSGVRQLNVNNNITSLSTYYPLFIIPSSASSSEVVNDISVGFRYENYIRKNRKNDPFLVTSRKFFDLYVNNPDGSPKDSPLLSSFVGYHQKYSEFHKDIEDYQLWGVTYNHQQNEALPTGLSYLSPVILEKIECHSVTQSRSDTPKTDTLLPSIFVGVTYLNPPVPAANNRMTADLVQPLMLLSKKNASVDPVWIEPRNQFDFALGDAQICKVKVPFNTSDFKGSKTISAQLQGSFYYSNFLFYFNVYDGSWAFLLYSRYDITDVYAEDAFSTDTVDATKLAQLVSYSSIKPYWVDVIDSGVLSLPAGKTIKDYDILITYPQKYVRELWDQPLNLSYVYMGDFPQVIIKKYDQDVRRHPQNNLVFKPEDMTPIHDYVFNQEKRDPTLWYHTTTNPFHVIDYNDQYMKDHAFNFFVGNAISLIQRGLKTKLGFTLYLRDKVTKKVTQKEVSYNIDNDFEFDQELLKFDKNLYIYQHKIGNPTQIQCTDHFRLSPNSTQDYNHNLTITGYADRDYSEQINEVSPNLFVSRNKDYVKDTPTANAYYKYFHCKKLENYPPTLKKITLSHDFVSRLKKDQEDTVEAILEYDPVPTNRVIVPVYPVDLDYSSLFYYSSSPSGGSISDILKPRYPNIAPDAYNESKLKENVHNREFYSRVTSTKQTMLFTVERNGYIKIIAPQLGWVNFINPKTNALSPTELPNLHQDPGYIRSFWLPDFSKETSDYELWIERISDVQTDYLDTSNIPDGWFSFTEDDAIKYFIIHRQYPQSGPSGPDWGKHHVNFRLRIRNKTDQAVVKQIDWTMIYESRDVEYVVDTSLGEIK